MKFDKPDEMEKHQNEKSAKYCSIFYSSALLIWSFYDYFRKGEFGVQFIILTLDLDDLLKRNNITEVFMTGLDAAACVFKTSIGAKRRGYKAVVLKDAIVTSNMGEMPKIWDKYKNSGILLTSLHEFK